MSRGISNSRSSATSLSIRVIRTNVRTAITDGLTAGSNRSFRKDAYAKGVFSLVAKDMAMPEPLSDAFGLKNGKNVSVFFNNDVHEFFFIRILPNFIKNLILLL